MCLADLNDSVLQAGLNEQLTCLHVQDKVGLQRPGHVLEVGCKECVWWRITAWPWCGVAGVL